MESGLARDFVNCGTRRRGGNPRSESRALLFALRCRHEILRPKQISSSRHGHDTHSRHSTFQDLGFSSNGAPSILVVIGHQARATTTLAHTSDQRTPPPWTSPWSFSIPSFWTKHTHGLSQARPLPLTTAMPMAPLFTSFPPRKQRRNGHATTFTAR